MIALRHKEAARTLVREDGFFSAFLVILIVSLTLMGLGAFMMLKTEGPNIVNEISSLRAEYAANAGVYFGMRRLRVGALNESSPITFGGSSVWMDTSKISGTTDVLLTVNSTSNNANRSVVVRLSTGDKLVDKALWTTGNVFNIDGKDSTGTIDNTKMVVAGADSIPSINVAALNALSTAQGHDQTAATFSPSDGYPMTNFYKSGTTPNVTHVLHNFNLNGGRTVYGIYVVEGNVTLNGSSRIQGVLYLPNPTSTIITGGGSPSSATVYGGIVSNGDISATGSHVSAEHWPDYMRTFCNYQLYPGVVTWNLVSWSY